MATEAMDAEATVAETMTAEALVPGVIITSAVITIDAEFIVTMMSQSPFTEVPPDGKETITISTNGDLMELATVK